ncbi:hypothetical protein [Halolamina sp. R1-12]|uniref:SipW-cognate class signal peptide n=1 Tax=Halolamina pelagica TaxID=699431 RepID=A0A1I5VZF1_9EURY|nr:hypothetical protein [Halolamina sp. R1-12]SFQ12386.1 hypothetical protein SAMN05216277_12125 [Halolamina pelagica]
MNNPTRRGVLSALGGVGLAAVAGSGLAGATTPPFSRYTLAQSTEPEGSLRVAWYERYNDVLVDGTGNGTGNATNTLDPSFEPSYVADAPGAVVSLGNVLPGDRGTLVVGLQAIDADLNVWFRPRILENAENGQNEPEIVAEGLDTNGVGELGSSTDILCWLDNSAVFGSCDGQPDPFEPRVRSDAGETAVGAFTAVADTFDDGVRLPFDGGDGCPDALPAGGNRCVGLRWELPDDVGNIVQSDSFEFALEFIAVSCSDDSNPFAEASE